MSSLIVEICKVENVRPHENSDNLSLCDIKGWQCVTRKDQFKNGDLVIYIPIDSCIPVKHSDRWGITNYLQSNNGRVKCAKLRGEVSFGVIIDPKNEPEEYRFEFENEEEGYSYNHVSELVEGISIAELYEITKYEPPVNRSGNSDSAKHHPLFVNYTDMENMRNFPNIFEEGEEVIITEKLHGSNKKVGLIEGEEVAGSNRVQRRKPTEGNFSTWWYAFELESIRNLINDIKEGKLLSNKQTLIYGEVYGPGIQNLHYGINQGNLGFRVFDILVEGEYLSWDDFKSICDTYGIETCPVLYKGPFSLETVKNYSSGMSTLDSSHIREGVVVGPLVERRDRKVGRVKLKYIGDQYLFKKDITDNKAD